MKEVEMIRKIKGRTAEKKASTAGKRQKNGKIKLELN
jgi:hypothetical protein